MRFWILVVVISSAVLAGCTEPSLPVPGDSVSVGDVLAGALVNETLMLNDCNMMQAGTWVLKDWVDPIVPPGFEAEEDAGGRTAVHVVFLSCGRAEFMTQTYDNVGMWYSAFDAYLQNESWGPDFTSVIVDLVVDRVALTEDLNGMGVPAVQGVVGRSERPVSPAVSRAVSAAGWSFEIIHADPQMGPLAGDVSRTYWTVNETAIRWDTNRTSTGGWFAAGIALLSGESNTGQMFGSQPVAPLEVYVLHKGDFRMQMAGRFDLSNA